MKWTGFYFAFVVYMRLFLVDFAIVSFSIAAMLCKNINKRFINTDHCPRLGLRGNRTITEKKTLEKKSTKKKKSTKNKNTEPVE